MCLERSKYEKRTTFRLKMKWSPFYDHAREDIRLKLGRTNTGKVTTRRFLRQKQRRSQLTKVPETMTKAAKETLKEPSDLPPSEARGYPRPPGAMAPPNTTQYLMDSVYEDLKMDAQSTLDGLYSAFDSCSERCLYFQQKDFEELFSTNQQLLDWVWPRSAFLDFKQ